MFNSLIGGLKNHFLAPGKPFFLAFGITEPIKVKFKIINMTGQGGIGLVLGAPVRIIIQFIIKPGFRHGADGIFFFEDIFPQGFRIMGMGKGTAHPHHGDLIMDFIFRA